MIFFFVFLVTARAIEIWPETKILTDMKHLSVPPTIGVRGKFFQPINKLALALQKIIVN